jgi:Flp pilus assembly protein TadD
MGNLVEALQCISWAVVVSPNDLSYHIEKGKLLLELHRHEEALAEFKDIIQLDPLNDVAYSTVATILVCFVLLNN